MNWPHRGSVPRCVDSFFFWMVKDWALQPANYAWLPGPVPSVRLARKLCVAFRPDSTLSCQSQRFPVGAPAMRVMTGGIAVFCQALWHGVTHLVLSPLETSIVFVSFFGGLTFCKC